LRRLALPPRHPELVIDQPATTVVQDRRAPHPACSLLHPPASRNPLDLEPLSADSPVHRATRGASDLIERMAHGEQAQLGAGTTRQCETKGEMSPYRKSQLITIGTTPGRSDADSARR
jgi:hypothetical protein